MEIFDAVVRRLIDTAEARAKAILDDNSRVVEALVTRQVDETLEEEALAELLVPVIPHPPVATNESGTQAGCRRGAVTSCGVGRDTHFL